MISIAMLAVGLSCPPVAVCPLLETARPLAADSAPVTGVTADTVHRRVKPTEVSESYELRLRIHRYASYATIPLFVAQTIAGNQLYQADKSGAAKPGWAQGVHGVGAAGLGVLFTVNTVTGVWNLWDSRHNDAGRTKRIVHSVLLLASDAGFAWSGANTGGGEQNGSQSLRDQHRNVAYASMGAALVGYGVMLVGRH